METTPPDSSKEQKENIQICEKHGIEFKQVFVHDVMLCSYCPECASEEEEKENKIKAIENDRLKLENSIRGIPKLFQNATLKNVSESDKIKKWYKEKTPFLFIFGDCGCGKTYLACAIKKRFNEIGEYCSLYFSSDLFLRIRQSFNGNGETEEEIIHSCSPESEHGNFAIFDDIGLNKVSEYTIETWYNIINRRYMNCSKTIFTSNLSLDEISDKMSDRIASRLASGIVHKMKGVDRRLNDNKFRNLCDIY